MPRVNVSGEWARVDSALSLANGKRYRLQPDVALYLTTGTGQSIDTESAMFYPGAGRRAPGTATIPFAKISGTRLYAKAVSAPGDLRAIPAD